MSAGIFRVWRWVLFFVGIGVVAGLGAVAFHYLTQLGLRAFLDGMAGYRPVPPPGEQHLFASSATPFNRWILLLLPAAGGILSGWLVFTFAPEAEGHGTDAAIKAYHHAGGFIRGRVPLVKMLSSAITLTTGGSGGREGPIAQIGAGFGSFLATRLGLSDRERRIMMAAGIGAGVGSIFRAPLAGALFAAEVLYRDPELEYEVIIPAGVSSVVAYCIFCMAFGWGSLFRSPDFLFRNPLELGPYTVLALVLVAAGFLYVKAFYGIAGIFERLKIPRHLKPALGGLCTGVIGFFLPHTLAFGYGFAQQALESQLTVPFLLSLALGKILTTSFSIGSGGSGGVFGPSMVIGGAVGGAVGLVFHQIMPGVVTSPGAFVVVGMAGFFTSVSNTPISTIIIVSEMTGSYHLLLPSLLVCSVTYAASRPWTIFHSQVNSRVDSPAHAGEFFVDILQAIHVRHLLDRVRPVTTIPQTMTFAEFKTYFAQTEQHYFPVVDVAGGLAGIFSVNDVRGVLFSPEIDPLVVMKDIGTSEIISTTPSEDLNTVMKKFTVKNIDSLPVVADEDPRRLIGMLNRREVIAYYNERLAARKAAD
jgi:CIC family chloride channel protein